MKEILKNLDIFLFNKFFIEIYQKYFQLKRNNERDFRRYILKIHKLRQYKKLTYWNNLFNHLSIHNVKGDIIECGVGIGETLSYILFNLIYDQRFSDKNYIGFDSFEGFPETHINDQSSIRHPAKGDWSFISEKFVLSNLQHLGFSLNNFKKIKFIKGFYKNTFSEENKKINKISLLHVDCDLYYSTKISLETWFSKVEKNGIIVFDEYLESSNSFPGAAKAIDEFLGEDKKNLKVCAFTKKTYFIKD